MIIDELIEELSSWSPEGDYSKTCDTIKCGRSDKELRKVAVSMFATPDLIRAVAEWGAELLIVHSPPSTAITTNASKATRHQGQDGAAERSGLTLYRYHDHPHCRPWT
jgi:putative NIF3 family GTP cyclohydrolase 1 type 2